MNDKQYPVAKVSEELINKIQTFEKDLKRDTDEEIVLIAYQKERS